MTRCGYCTSSSRSDTVYQILQGPWVVGYVKNWVPRDMSSAEELWIVSASVNWKKSSLATHLLLESPRKKHHPNTKPTSSLCLGARGSVGGLLKWWSGGWWVSCVTIVVSKLTSHMSHINKLGKMVENNIMLALSCFQSNIFYLNLDTFNDMHIIHCAGIFVVLYYSCQRSSDVLPCLSHKSVK